MRNRGDGIASAARFAFCFGINVPIHLRHIDGGNRFQFITPGRIQCHSASRFRCWWSAGVNIEIR